MKPTIKTLMIAIAILVTSITASLAQDFQKGLDAQHKGDYVTALREFRALAKQGNAYAQYNLGQMYYNGRGVTQDYIEALNWYRKAAEQGFAYAQYNIGLMNEDGRGVTQNAKAAVKWYRKAAEQGNVSAQNNLAVMYARGKGVIRNNFYAHMWFNIAASNGHGNAEKGRDLVATKMTASQVGKAQKLARECVQKNYKGC